VAAYRRSSNGGELLSDRNISTNYVISLSTTVRRGSGTVGLTKTVIEVEGMPEGGATYPSPVLSVRLFWIYSI
jgi:hypothetical protein